MYKNGNLVGLAEAAFRLTLNFCEKMQPPFSFGQDFSIDTAGVPTQRIPAPKRTLNMYFGSI